MRRVNCSVFPLYLGVFSVKRSEQGRTMLLFLAFNVREHTNNHIERGRADRPMCTFVQFIDNSTSQTFRKGDKILGDISRKDLFSPLFSLNLVKV